MYYAQQNRDEVRIRTLKHYGQEYRGGTQQSDTTKEQSGPRPQTSDPHTWKKDEEAARDEGTEQTRETNRVKNTEGTKKLNEPA